MAGGDGAHGGVWHTQSNVGGVTFAQIGLFVDFIDTNIGANIGYCFCSVPPNFVTPARFPWILRTQIVDPLNVFTIMTSGASSSSSSSASASS